MTTPVTSIVPAPPAIADALFADRLDVAKRYAQWLAGPGVERGLVGPRESSRVWDRHLVNCAAITALIEPGRTVVDLGSGAGLPGIAIAIARPDLRVVLVDSMARRTAFLEEVVADLELPRVSVRRARAEELAPAHLDADVVTARAVAPLARLVGWASPLLSTRGRLLALKGDNAEQEVAENLPAVRHAGFAGRVEVVAIVAEAGVAYGHRTPRLRALPQATWTASDEMARTPVPTAGRMALVVRLDRFPPASPARRASGLG